MEGQMHEGPERSLGGTGRLSSQQARTLLGLSVAPAGSRDKDLSTSVASSSADSADVAGGRGARLRRTFSRDSSGRMATGTAADEFHLHPSRSLWEAHATPSPSPTPSATAGSVGEWNRDSPYRSASSGGGLWTRAADTLWYPSLPETGPALGLGSGNGGGRLVNDAWLRERVDTAMAPRGGSRVDRPAVRGQEYKRERRRIGWGVGGGDGGGRGWSMRPGNRRQSSPWSASSLMRSGSGEEQPQSDPNAGDTRQRFLGMRWPPGLGLPRRRRDTSESSESWDTATDGHDLGAGEAKGFGGVGAHDLPKVSTSAGDGRLSISIDGHTELGKGLGGHTAYRILVGDRAIGDQWMVLRRFRQFEELHRELLPVLSREPDANAYVLPPKELFGGRHGGVISKRLKLLKVYLHRLVTCRAAIEDRAMASFLELHPALRGRSAYARKHGPECVMKEGRLRVKRWDGPHKPVINIMEAGLRLLGWVSSYAIVSPGPVFLVYRGSEDDPEKPIWVLPDRRTIGSRVRVRRVDLWKADPDKDATRFFLVTWEKTSLLCQVESEASLASWTLALDEDVDLRPQQTDKDRAKVDIELKAKEAWTSREEGIWGGL